MRSRRCRRRPRSRARPWRPQPTFRRAPPCPEDSLLAAAARKTGTNRFRYALGTVDWALGDVTVSFPATRSRTRTEPRRRHDDAGRVQRRVRR